MAVDINTEGTTGDRDQLITDNAHRVEIIDYGRIQAMPLKHTKWSGLGDMANGDFRGIRKEAAWDAMVIQKAGGLKCPKWTEILMRSYEERIQVVDLPSSGQNHIDLSESKMILTDKFTRVGKGWRRVSGDDSGSEYLKMMAG